VVVGSYVPKSSEQLALLRESKSLREIELPVSSLIDPGKREQVIRAAREQIDRALAADEDVVLFTSREYLGGGTPAEALNIGRSVSDALVSLVQTLAQTPRYLIAKGGITSNDIAVRGLQMKRAMVVGQILPGVPVWRMGAETRHPGLHYVVFPGNVGSPTALAELVSALRARAPELAPALQIAFDCPARSSDYPRPSMRHTISVLVENKFGVLTRIAGMFSGRGFNIDSLNVGPTLEPTTSRMTIVVRGDDTVLEQVTKQLHKLIDVIEIQDFRDEEIVERELVLMRVKADANSRAEVMQICDIFRAKIIDVQIGNLAIEITGNESKIDKFVMLMGKFGISELTRTGRLALARRPE
jgi:acetolactate synthase-1/3 small subunit